VTNLQRAPVRVARTSGAARRLAALASARFTAVAANDLLTDARAWGWEAIGGAATVGDAALTWRPVGPTQDEAVWQVTVIVQREAEPVTFVATLDPTDGALLELAKAEVVR
jgi:hypothetical protein